MSRRARSNARLARPAAPSGPRSGPASACRRGVEVEAFPEEVYRDSPSLREYRYINRDSRTYIVEPHERRVIEEID
ncbi:DUF1236 domain-containing protein [Bradyrhizobium sp. USDA 4449]